MTEKNYFENLYNLDMGVKVESKNSLKYLPWASAWAKIKKIHPDATFKVFEQIIDDKGNTRYWFDDGRTGWVKVSVTVNNLTLTETLPIMNNKNLSVSSEEITSVIANKSIKRCLAKACALHGLGLYLYEGEDIPEEIEKIIDLRDECMKLVIKKCSLSPEAKKEVEKICKSIDENANGDPRLIDDSKTLEELKKKLLAVRK